MEALPITAVLVSTLSHAWWNYLAKRAGADHAFFGLSKWVEIVIYLPLFVLLAWNYSWPPDTALYIVGAAALVGLNYVALASAYARIDLGIAYPISRTSTLFLPVIAYLLLGETIDGVGVLALVLVTVGVILSSGIGIRRQPGMVAGIAFALLGALTLAGYTVWDKFVIASLDPFLYLYAYNCVIAMGYLPVLLHRRVQARASWDAHRGKVVQVAVLNTATYLLVLYALMHAKASYVGALRQLSLVVAVGLSVWLLKEKLNASRLLGVALLIGGGVAVTLAG